MHHSHHKRSFAPLFSLVIFYFATSTALRIVLWFYFCDGTRELQGLALILGSGFLNDIPVAIYISVLPILYLSLTPASFLQQTYQQRLFAIITFASLFGMLYLSVTEFFFFDEFNSRFNLVAVDYLIYPHEVLVNIWDSYPVLQVMLIALLISILVYRRLWPALNNSLQQLTTHPSKRRRLALMILVLPLALLCSTDSFSFSKDRISNQISINGLSSLFRAFRTNEINYQTFYRTINRSTAYSLMRSTLLQPNELYASPHLDNLTRYHSTQKGLGQMNVVVIVEESFGANYVGAYGDKRQLTPRFDQLSLQGLLFDHCYATGTRTVRGLEAITTSFPPIPSESILKRPGNEHIANWGSTMNELGYRSSFLYGGYGYFDNMNYFYKNNGFDIQDRSNIDNPEFSNIWGVSDEDLFNHALRYYNQQTQPFFSIVMTTSNHKPYTFPEGIEGVSSTGGGRKAGIRYADYALGHFFDQAVQQPWYDNTLFVIVADHGARVYGRAQVPIKSYEIPLLILAPAKLAPQNIPTLTSQLDIAPTVMGLLGLNYAAPFYGQDILHIADTALHPILLNHNHDVALYQNQQLAILGLNKHSETVNYLPDNNIFSPAKNNMQLIDLATAYYQTAFDLFKRHRYL